MAHAHLPWDESNSVIFPQRSRKADHEYYLALTAFLLLFHSAVVRLTMRKDELLGTG